MLPLSVRIATPPDAEAVHALLADAGDALAARGFNNWLPAYPRDRVADDIAAQVVRVVRDTAGTVVATYMLRSAPRHPYEGIAWGASDDAAARYLNRLAVAPSHEGQGIGRWCLGRIAEECASKEVAAVRCDVLAVNLAVRRFYERNGYELRGARRHSGWEFAVYEKVLRLGE